MISRRNFLKMSMFGAGLVIARPWFKWNFLAEDWPDAERLARNCTGGMINIRAKPSADSESLETIYEDTVLVWLREVVGEAPAGLLSRRWVETPSGYVYAPSVQPVFNQPNAPITTLPETSIGRGMWAEVTVPYVDIYLDNEPNSPWLKEVPRPRLYYSQVLWVDDVATNSMGQVLYRINEQYGSYGDIFWAAAEAFRPITEEEISPIHPEASDKRIVVDLNYQTLSCYEGQQEVYFCRISSGAKFDAAGNPVDKWSTPVGAHLPWRKVLSIHMSGGSTGAGWDTPGIPWTMLFDPDGAAIHSTFWHNDFGNARSHGCVNARPEDSKWIFRWSLPQVSLIPGNMDISGPGGTVVDVIAA
ncbi:MAG: L,D-transpeptidase [Chloroflexi bacterium]|nr:L,D-transpeptidase [Anaerolineaceae bacterium]NMB88801.1 L,D-transpeptidase [Chloroflexota bacterium]